MPTIAQELFESWMEHRRWRLDLPGIVAMVGDKEEWSYCGGKSHLPRKTPFTETTPFPVASLTKVFTTTLVMQLRDRGLLILDTPVREILPDFMSSSSEAPVVTIRHLLSQTSGLAREANPGCWNKLEFPSDEAVTSMLPALKTVFPPGEQYKYSNLGFAVLGQVISALCKKPFAEVMKEQILIPLGLDETHAHLPEDQSGIARGYGPWSATGARPEQPILDLGALRAGGSLISTAKDVFQFLNFWLDPSFGSDVLSPESRKEMLLCQMPPSRDDGGQALGWAMKVINEKQVYWHTGWLPGFRCCMAFVPAENIRVVLFVNAQDEGPIPLTDGLIKLLLRYPADSPRSPELLRYTGLFGNLAGKTFCSVEGNRLLLMGIGLDAPHALGYLTPDGPEIFRYDSNGGVASRGERAFFEFDGGPAPARLWLGDTYLDRTGENYCAGS